MKAIRDIFLCFLLGSNALFATDVEVNIVEGKTQKPIEGVNICWQTLECKKVEASVITDAKGKAYLPTEAGSRVVIEVSCIGYKTLIDTVVLREVNLFSLQQDVFNLGQVVVTGHGKPIAIDSSLYGVKIIGKQKIVSSGATSLADLFLTEPNVKLNTDFVLGTRIEMFGMSGRNVKVMIDGVPVIGRLNGQIDLGQITVDNIDHIEIIEGPMSVVYGNNALAGTINIVTHKNTYFDTEARINAGVESVGRYEGALGISQKIGRNIVTLSGNYSNFRGVDFNKKDRSMEWKPQQQYRLLGNYLAKLGLWSLEAKASAYKSKVTRKGNVEDYRAHDWYYFTDRYTGAIKLQGSWSKATNLSVLLSHSYYNRSSQEATKDLTTLQEVKQKKTSSQREANNLLRVVWSHSFAPEVSVESGIDCNLSSMKGKRIKDDKQQLNDYAAFFNLRYQPFHNFQIQPGLRVAYNTAYDAPVLYSLNAKWDLMERLSLRASVAKGYRAPTVKEMYVVFVDSNHKIYGNDSLQAEKSDNYTMSIDYKLKWKQNYLKISSQLFYNAIDNLITLIEKQNSEAYQYNNINHYKTRGGNLGASFFYKDILRLNASMIATGRYNKLNSSKSNIPKFTTTIDGIAGLQLKEPTTKIKLNADIKCYGKQNYFYYAENNEIKEGSRATYEILNVSMHRSFLKDKLQITLGAKNLTNVKTVKLAEKTGATGHSSGGGSPVAYGTSFFAKASFRFTNSKK